MKVFLVHEEGVLPAEPTAYTAATKHDAEMDYIATYCATTEDTWTELVEYVRFDSRDLGILEGLYNDGYKAGYSQAWKHWEDSGHDPAKLDGLNALLEAVRFTKDQLERRFATITKPDPQGDLIKAYVDLKDRLAAFEGASK